MTERFSSAALEMFWWWNVAIARVSLSPKQRIDKNKILSSVKAWELRKSHVCNRVHITFNFIHAFNISNLFSSAVLHHHDNRSGEQERCERSVRTHVQALHDRRPLHHVQLPRGLDTGAGARHHLVGRGRHHVWPAGRQGPWR